MYPERKITVMKKEQLEDPTWKLFNRVWPCRIEYIYTINQAVTSEYGHIVSDDPEDAQRQADATVLVSLSIPNMVDKYRNNIPFWLTPKADVHTMYEMIHDHIKRWHEYTLNNFDTSIVPVDDLLAMGEFASALYEVRDRRHDKITVMKQGGESFRKRNTLLPSAFEAFRNEANKEEQKQEQYRAPAPHLETMSGLERIMFGRSF